MKSSTYLQFLKIWSLKLSNPESVIKYVRKIFEKLTFITPWYAHVCAWIRGLEMLLFQNILRTYLIDGPFADTHKTTFSRIQNHIVSKKTVLYYLKVWAKQRLCEFFVLSRYKQIIVAYIITQRALLIKEYQIIYK